MIVRNFMQWARTAAAAQRAEGAGALARAYLYSQMDERERRDAEIALMSLLDDPSPLVRRALSDNFASAADAPRSLISALASDQSDIAAPVLSRSPLLSDAELIDCAAIGDAYAQSAIALRARVPMAVGAALAEVGAREAAISLAVNPGAELAEFSMRRMIERFGDDGEMREALLARPWLPAAIRSELVAATAASLTAFVVDCAWLSPERAERLSREARDKANVAIVADTALRDGRSGVRELVAYLRESGQLTPSLVLRALLSGNRDLLEAALVELSGLREDRVAGHLREFRGAGFAALYAKAGLPAKFLPAFRAALEAQREFGAMEGGEARLSLVMVERVLTACEELNGGELDRLMALLRRFEVEAALEQARAEAPLLSAPAGEESVYAPVIDMDALEAAMAEAA
ncbi:DUF2336 domain-containing protein [Methylocystis heyeri]|uniref:DUF2336 domain-containing protein n=1 Tax=Methylocystis heyeri TaxID=391905 RepID=A0A6B8KL92_9HYPH|nr:DUF2336 domain-containing protein [Methylocystis heyeri]QGM47518.1 DUF2336 domain-containing protein [Methylocystis heyeri]